MVVQGDPGSVSLARRPSLLHAAAYAVLRRDAFEPQLYASFAGQNLEFQPRWLALRQMTAPTTLDCLDPAFTHLLVIDPAYGRLDPTLPITPLVRGERFALYRRKT